LTQLVTYLWNNWGILRSPVWFVKLLTLNQAIQLNMTNGYHEGICEEASNGALPKIFTRFN